ncbi:hypothetical protein SKAU_G00291890 [Synaphobranchus kaupii]|uniref:Membrane protein BRI3 n=1 Tax=Synaphobranchus kaupii TaxID=118154 RepID=A0A9Q1IMG3_SYNKA|nr:hypothetical protein SKAU_G00291890 [Synaphobranchus kaupii]
MNNKPLLQDRPPAYNGAPGGYDYGYNYGAIPSNAPPQQPPPPYYGQGYPQMPHPQMPHPQMPHPQLPPVAQQPNITVIQPSVVVVGGCPACRVGVLEDDFTCLGILCAIIFFPIGLLCCLAMRQRMCPNCGATFG